MGIKQRRTFADYLQVAVTDDKPKFAFMGAGFTDLNETPSAQTGSKRYVCDKSATKSITGYDWSVAFVTDQIREEEAVDYICNIGEKQLTGADAETAYVRVDLDKKVGASGTEYEARLFHVAVEVASFDNNDGEMAASGNLLGIGDPVFGKFDTTTRVFTAEADTPTE